VTAPDRSDDDHAVETPRRHALAQHYEITVQGHLASRWSAWFDGLELVRTTDGTTVISGPIVDQAALHGVLQKLRDLGIPLISLAATPAHTDNSERT
jgi:hypothetical protein